MPLRHIIGPQRTCSNDCRSSASGSPVLGCSPVKYPLGPRRLLLAGTTPNDMAPLPALPALHCAQASSCKRGTDMLLWVGCLVLLASREQ